MTIKQLKEWLFNNSQDDQWWVNIDGIAEQEPVTIPTIEEMRKVHNSLKISVLHISQTELNPPPWMEIEHTLLQAPSHQPPPLPIQNHQRQDLTRQKSLGDDAGMRLLIPVGRSGWAIAAGYLGLFGLVIFPAPLALIVSIIAIMDIRKSKDTESPKYGMGRAIFGLIVGIIGTLVLLVLLAYDFYQR
mgnify:CR=1 FL=1|jgi:hypothetical protein|tara:strand:+ start:329 stop:892 length:564 start_codon:yes stop_codon:yes gene_type:complete